MHITSPNKVPEQTLSNEYFLNFSNWFPVFYLNTSWASAELPRVGKILPQDLHRGYFFLIFCSLYSALQRTEPVCSLVQTTAASVHGAYLKELYTKKVSGR